MFVDAGYASASSRIAQFQPSAWRPPTPDGR
jgi:hypothetical protein